MLLVKLYRIVPVAAAIVTILLTGHSKAYGQVRDSIQLKNDSIKVSTLREVIVKHKILLQGKSITPVQLLKGTALQNMNSLSVADAVRYFSGVQLKDYGGIGGLKTIDTRSMGSNHTGVFYDGIQLGNVQNGQVDLGKFSLDNLEEISLYNAQKSDIFQPAKSFGTAASIYLQSRVPLFNHDEKNHIRASVKTGSFGLINPSLLWERKISTNVYTAFSSEWIKANGSYKFRYTNGTYDTTANRENADLNAWRFEGGVYGMLKDSSRWNVKLYYYTAERGLPGAIVANKFEHGQRQWDKNFFAQSSFKSKPGGKYSFMLNAKFASDYMRYLDPEFVTTQGYLDNRYRQQEFYFSFANLYKIKPWWDVSLSTDLQWNYLDANLYHFAYPTRYTSLTSLASQLQFNRFTIQKGILATMVWDKVKDYQDAGNKKELTPFISASWQPFSTGNLRLRGFYKNIFRLPTFNDLYYTYIGNTNLRPEYTTQYDVGFTWMKQLNGVLQYISLQGDGYYNVVKDKIVAVPTTNLYRWMMLNLGRVEIKGIDIGAESSLSISQKLMVNAAIKYTYQQALDVTPGATNFKHQIPYVPNHNGSFILNSSWKDYNLNYSFIYTGERFSQKMNIPVNYLQPWYTQDVSVSKTIRHKKSTIKVLLEINNILNQYYDVVINFPMPGRYYRLGLSVNYQ